MNAERLAEKVADATTALFGRRVSPLEITSPTNKYRENVVARNVYRKILKEYGLSVSQIGRMTNSNHCTVIHSLNVYDNAVGNARREYKTIMNSLSESVKRNSSYEEYEESVFEWADETIQFMKDLSHDDIQGWVRAKVIEKLEQCKKL